MVIIPKNGGWMVFKGHVSFWASSTRALAEIMAHFFWDCPPDSPELPGAIQLFMERFSELAKNATEIEITSDEPSDPFGATAHLISHFRKPSYNLIQFVAQNGWCPVCLRKVPPMRD